MTGKIDIVPVEGKAMLERFIRVGMDVNADDPNYIPPLLFERRDALSKKNPFFEHADVQFWLAVRDGKDVGRISAQIDHLAKEDPALPTGHFGMIAAVDDPAVFAALFAAAEAWLKARGKVRAQGPYNLSVNEECGLLVEGLDSPPFLMMPHDPAYTPARVEELGYTKVKDVYAYFGGIPDWPPGMKKRLSRPLPEGSVFRPIDFKRFDAELTSLVEIYNDAWADNWNSVPITVAETKFLKESLSLLLKPELIWFMELDGEPAAFGVLLPDLNYHARDLKGRLFPFGWAKLLWRLKMAPMHRGRVCLMGVKRKFHRDPRGQMAPFWIINALMATARKYGLKESECSWILEDNAPMRNIMEKGVKFERYKTYRLYERAIG